MNTSRALPIDEDHNHADMHRLKEKTQDEPPTKPEQDPSVRRVRQGEAKREKNVLGGIRANDDDSAVEPPVKEEYGSKTLRESRDVEAPQEKSDESQPQPPKEISEKTAAPQPGSSQFNEQKFLAHTEIFLGTSDLHHSHNLKRQADTDARQAVPGAIEQSKDFDEGEVELSEDKHLKTRQVNPEPPQRQQPDQTKAETQPQPQPAAFRRSRQAAQEVEAKETAQKEEAPQKVSAEVERKDPTPKDSKPRRQASNDANSEKQPQQPAQALRRYRQADDKTKIEEVQDEKAKEKSFRRIRSDTGAKDKKPQRSEEQKSQNKKIGDEEAPQNRENGRKSRRSIFESQEKTNTDDVREHISLVRLIRSFDADPQKIPRKREAVDITFLQDPLTNPAHYYTIIDSRPARSADQFQVYTNDGAEIVEDRFGPDDEHSEGHGSRRYF